MTPEEVQANNKLTFLKARHSIVDNPKLTKEQQYNKYPLYIKALLKEIDLLQEALHNPVKDLSKLDRDIGEWRILERQAMYNIA